MKLAYVTSTFPYGTPESFLVPEVDELREQGHLVTAIPVRPRGSVESDRVVTARYAISHDVASPRILFQAVLACLGQPRSTLRALGLLRHSASARILIRNLASFPKALWLGRELRRGQYDHVHAAWASVPATVAMCAAELSGVPFSFVAHRWDIEENNLLDVKIERAGFARFISRSGIGLAREVLGKDPGPTCVVIHLGVRPPPKSATSTERLHAPPVLLCPAALIPRKGHSYLLRAVDKLRSRGTGVRLLLSGDGSLRLRLEDEVRHLGLEGVVRIEGHVSHQALLDRYESGEIDLVVLPSLAEGIPVALMEAMIRSVPVVATDVGGTSELVPREVLVPPGDADALAQSISWVLEQSGRRKHLADRCRECARSRFSAPETTAALLALLRETRQKPDLEDL